MTLDQEKRWGSVTTIKTNGTTLVLLGIVIIQIGSTFLLMGVEP